MDIVIQTSSAALLAILGLLVLKDHLPPISKAWVLYLGAVSFAVSFGAACVEQVLSGKAYQAQKLVVQEYYSKKSERTADVKAIRRADVIRALALIVFAVAVTTSSLGLVQIARIPNANDTAASASPTAAAASTAASPTAAASTAAAASAAATAAASTAASTAAARTGLPRWSAEIQSGLDPSSAAEEVMAERWEAGLDGLRGGRNE